MTTSHCAAFASVVLALGLSACGGGNQTEGDLATDTLATTPTAQSTPSDSAAPTPVLTVASSPAYGDYLADGNGRTLYLSTADTAGVSTCTDACADFWSPDTASGGMPAGNPPQVQTALIGTTQREDGTEQLTYNQHPLYYYEDDVAPGDITGQDVTEFGAEWYLVTPAGEKLESEGGETSQETAGQQ